MASRFQAVPLVASPTYPNAIAWSNENLIAVASGHLVTILNPAMPSGPKGLITIPTTKPFPFGLIERKDLLSNCMLPICLSRDIRPSVQSISWSPLGLSPNSGCLLAVCTTEGIVKIYQSPFREFSSEWIEVHDVSEMLHTYYEKIRYKESDFQFLEQEYNDDMPLSKLLIRCKDRKQNLLEYRKRPSIISPQQYASRSSMLSSLIVSWSPIINSNSSRKCSILAIGGKNGNISFWRFHEPQCYSITQRSTPPGVVLIGVIQAHDSWITAISWSKFDSDLLLSTGSSDGSVKIWRGDIDDVANSTEDGDNAFTLLKDVVNVGSGPTSVLSLIVPEASTQKILLAIGKGSGSLQVCIYDISVDKFDLIGPHYGHDQIVTGLIWAYDGRCLYSCSQDNSLHSWILKGDSLHEVSLPPNILGVKTFTDVPNVSDACFGIAISPANLVVAVVRSFDVNLLNPMYQARSQKAAVEFFWIGGQNLGSLKDSELNDENVPGFPDMDLVNWGQNILWSLSQHENLHKPLVLWDMISSLSSFKNSQQQNYVQQIIIKWLISNLGFEWDPSGFTILPCVSTLTTRQLHLLNIINRHLLLPQENLDNKNEEKEEQESKIWIKILEISEKELRERLVCCCFSNSFKGYNGNLTQMRQWVGKNDVKDYVKLLASKVKKIDKRNIDKEECSYCSSPVSFEDTEIAFCENENHKLTRCGVSMSVCPLTPLWFCVSCKRWVSNFAPECLFTLTGYPSSVDFEKRSSSLQNGEILLKPLCPFCGVLLQRLQPEFLLSTTPV